MSEQSIFGNGGYTAYSIASKDSWDGENSQLWIVLGQADAWDGGLMPPEDPSSIPNPIYYKRATAKLCRVLTADEVAGGMTGDTTYKTTATIEGTPTTIIKHVKFLTDAEAIAGKYHTLFVSQTLYGDDIGGDSVTFRAIGFVTDLVPTTGNEDKDILIPSEVENQGCILNVWHRENAKTIDGGDSLTPRTLIQLTSNEIA